jgi:hypothetical protein
MAIDTDHIGGGPCLMLGPPLDAPGHMPTEPFGQIAEAHGMIMWIYAFHYRLHHQWLRKYGYSFAMANRLSIGADKVSLSICRDKFLRLAQSGYSRRRPGI